MNGTTKIVFATVLVIAGACSKKDKDLPKGKPGSGTATTPKPIDAAQATGSGSAGSGSAGSAAAPPDNRISLKDVGFSTPESVFYDAGADVYLVSNINGEPAGVDDNGFISKVSPEGKVTELKWIDGTKADVKLDAPKGMAIVGDTLWVADITVVRKFDAKTGKPKGEVKIEGSVFLNDVTAGPDGGIFVSDTGVDAKFAPTGKDAIYQIGKDGKVKPLIKNKDLGGPNGLTFANGSVWVVTFVSGEVYEVTAKGEKKPGVKLPKGQLDGIVERDGELMISSWEGKAIYSGKPGGDWKQVATDLQAPADIGWDSKRNALLVPQFMDHNVHIIAIAK